MDDMCAPDADVAAIRALMADNAEPNTTPTIGKLPNNGVCISQLDSEADLAARKKRSKRPYLLKSALAGILIRAKTYRPDRKAILWTSVVLLLLLQPVLFLGSILSLAIITLGVFLRAGPDVFWRRTVAGFAAYARWFPVSARRIRIRGQWALRRWHRFLGRLPSRWSDSLRVPDLRALAKADQRHVDAMDDRLSRLRDDRPV